MHEDSTTGVMIALDWENVRRGAQIQRRRVSPEDVAEALSNVGRIFGELRGGKAFGDWSLRPDDGAAFAAAGISPYHAPRTMAGKDRADPSILLEVYDWIRDPERCATIVLASGDADFQVLVDRARERGRRIVICAFSHSVARDMLAAAPLFPLEAELGIQTAEHGDVPVPQPGEREEQEESTMTRFIKEMARLEGRMNFVGYSMLCNQWMLDWGLGWSDYECRQMVDHYCETGIAERHEVHNPNNPDWPTTAVRLIRDHETVRNVLGPDPQRIINPVIPEHVNERSG